ncbi:Rid family detoxifying hydrolase [Haloglomus litoreum]|uniref:Rid family detoxifying hydrolase n=1 Tax=Haloglomus litoreum TaxID=3034026 RepID=UPI0023E8F19A|nr:Rid family detoxifying hydrolase [Haloglomus sp. DT116]
MFRAVSTSGAPPEEQAYSHATVANGFVFTAGQIPVTPDGTPVEGSVAEQTRQVMENLGAILAEAGTGFEHVVRTTAYFRDVDDFPAMDEVYAEYFEGPPPARDVVEVRDLPEGAALELVMVATEG